MCLFLKDCGPSPTPFWEKVKKKFSVRLLQLEIFGASKYHEMARYDLPTYVLYVSGHFWIFGLQITGKCIFIKKFRTFETQFYF